MTGSPKPAGSNIIISTHILTKRMTALVTPKRYCLTISTHILTKRMTLIPIAVIIPFQYFNSHPHEEDDYHIESLHPSD